MRIPGKIQVSLPGHGDVGEVLLQHKDVPAHLLDAGLADPLEVLRAVDEDAGDQVAQTFVGTTTHKHFCDCVIHTTASRSTKRLQMKPRWVS